MKATDPTTACLRAEITGADERLARAKAAHDAVEIRAARLALCDALRAIGDHVRDGRVRR